MADDTYNGWSNRETWLVNLWLTNEEGSYRMIQEWVDEEIADTDDADSVADRRDDAAQALADRLEAMHDDALSEIMPTHGVFNDLLIGALARVDWREIADNIMSDVELDEPPRETDNAGEVTP